MTHNDEVGLFLDKKHQGCGIGFTLLMLVEQSVAGNRILANVSPRNKRSQRFFEKVGYKLIQYTYEKALPS
jgi:RimJ/RimL family protein N-acetyltransferase